MKNLDPTKYDVEDTRTGFDNHGSCVSSKACGAKYGVAKKSNLVVVKWPLEKGAAPGKRGLVESALLDGMNKIIKDVIAHPPTAFGRPSNAVVNLSFTGRYSNLARRLFTDALQDLFKLEVVVVAAAGNKRVRRLFDLKLLLLSANLD